MADNRGLVYLGPGKVEVQDIEFPEFKVKDGPGVPKENVGREAHHGAILKIVSTNICGSDQHMVRGRTTAPEGLVLGHEITGEVVETGRDVEFIKEGDLCSVPFNIACGRCRMCKEGHTGVCLNVNPERPGGAPSCAPMTPPSTRSARSSPSTASRSARWSTSSAPARARASPVS